MAAGTRLSMRDALPIWWRVARQWFTGSDRWQARLYVLACVVLAISTTWLAVKISYTQKHFSTALAEKNQAEWKAAVWEFVVIILIAAPLKALEVYVDKRLVAVWRAALSQAFITAYTTNRSYFHMQLARGTEGAADSSEAGQDQEQDGRPPLLLKQAATPHEHMLEGSTDFSCENRSKGGALQLAELAGVQQQDQQPSVGPVVPDRGQGATEADRALAGTPSKPAYISTPVAGLSLASAAVDNPDQRITNDVANFVSTSVTLVHLLGKKVLNCAAFAGVLWSISPRLVLFLVCYALMGTLGTAWVFGRPLTALQQKILKLEADLRFGLVRLRENAEAIAFYGGDKREGAHLSQSLAAMLAVLLRRISWLGGYELWVNAYSFATILLPSLVLAPEYFQGTIPFGTLTQASYAFSTLEQALGLILARLDDFSSLAAETARLDGLLRALQAADVDAGGSGTVRGFEQGTGGGSAAGILGQGLVGFRSVLRRQKKSQSKSDAGGAHKAAVDDEDEAGEVDESTQLLVADGDRAGTTPNRRVSSTTVANGQQQCGAASTTGSDSTAAIGGGSGGCGASAGRPSRVLRLMDGSTPGFSVEDLSAWVPGRHHMPTCVCTELSFSIAPGESLLVMGPSGCGKSSLLRVIAGLWTIGSGTIRGPPPQQLFFLPQKPFMPLGSLRQQLVFPATWHKSSSSSSSSFSAPTAAAGAAKQRQSASSTGGSYDAASSFPAVAAASAVAALTSSGPSSTCITLTSLSSTASTDSRLKQLLDAVKLGHLLHRFDTGLDTEVEWAGVLSLGEQQRVALVRLLYHQPQLAFMDEATSALDPKSEAVVYGLVGQACSSYVSVGHRLQLLDWHSHVLVSVGQGLWIKYTAAEYRQRLAAGLES